MGASRCPPPRLLVIRTGGGGTASSWAVLSPKGQSLPGWWPAASLSRADGRGFYHQHPGPQLLSLPCGGPFRGRRGGMWAQCQAQRLPPMLEKSAELPGRGASLPVLPRQAGPRPGPASLSVWVPPWDQKEEAGRQGAKILESCGLPAV